MLLVLHSLIAHLSIRAPYSLFSHLSTYIGTSENSAWILLLFKRTLALWRGSHVPWALPGLLVTNGEKNQNRKGKRRGKKGWFLSFIFSSDLKILLLHSISLSISSIRLPLLAFLYPTRHVGLHLTTFTKLLRGLPGTFELAHYMDFDNLPPVPSSQFIGPISLWSLTSLTISQLWNLSIPTLRTWWHVITNYFLLLPGSANQAPALKLTLLALDFIMLSHNRP